MPNARIIYNNAADRGATEASTTSGALVVANLRTDIKSKIHRASGNSVAYTHTWTASEQIGALILANCKLSPLATLRMVGYSSASAVVGVTAPLFDTGTVLACAGARPDLWGWETNAGANSFAYGGAVHARLWLETQHLCQKVYIELIDTGVVQLEVSRLIIGPYWELEKNVDYGASVSLVDTTENSRNDAGDLVSDIGTTHSKLSLPMSKLEATDRNQLWRILRGNGKARPVFASLFPDSDDPDQEQMFQVYGKLVSTPSMALPSYNLAAATIEIEGI